MTHIKRVPSSLWAEDTSVDFTRKKAPRKSLAPGMVETGTAVSSFERFIDGGNKRREKEMKFLKHKREKQA